MRLLRTALVLALVVAAAVPATAGPVAEPPWLGVGIVGGIRGVRVSEIIDDTPAAHAGLIAGDEILAVAGERVTAPAELIATVGKHRIGEDVRLTVGRAGRVFQTRAVLAVKPSEGEILHRRLVGKPAPLFDAPVVRGDHLGRLADLRGRVVVLAFSATQCDPCARLHRRLSRFADQHGNTGLSVLSIVHEAKDTLDAWAESLAPSFEVLHDPGGAVAGVYRVAQLPALVVVDRDGRVVYAGIGGEDDLDAALLAAERALGLRRWL